MLKINRFILKDSFTNLHDGIDVLAYSITKLNGTVDILETKVLYSSIRYILSSVFTQTESFLRLVLGSNGIDIENMTLESCLYEGKVNGILDEGFANLLKDNIKFIYPLSHTFDSPRNRDLVEFYSINRKHFYNQLILFKSLYDSELERLKDTDIFNK